MVKTHLKNPFFTVTLVLIVFLNPILTQGTTRYESPRKSVVNIVWGEAIENGSIEAVNGTISKISIINLKGTVIRNSFSILGKSPSKISITVERQWSDSLERTLIKVKTNKHDFSFFLNDVNKEFPVYSPDYKVAILEEADNRSFEEIEYYVRSKKLKTRLEKIEDQEEDSFDNIKDQVIQQEMPIWLGLGQDVRMFQMIESSKHHPKQLNTISPQYISSPTQLREVNNKEAIYGYALGRGQGIKVDSKRRLGNGVLPILHSTYRDNDILYRTTSFVSKIETTLNEKMVEVGTPTYISDMFSHGYRNSPGYVEEREQQIRAQIPDILNLSGNVALYFRSVAVNESDVPRYAWFKTASPGASWSSSKAYIYTFDPNTGFSSYGQNKVFAVSRLNGKPLTSEEVSILLKPGETATLEFFIPHNPINEFLANLLAKQSFLEHYHGAISYWNQKLSSAANIQLPEKRIEEMLKAGLLHLDLVTFGSKTEDILAANAGRFLPIGTESAPIIQFYCSMGWLEIARKSLAYFLKKQHEDGSLMNYQDYMVETGAVLWSIGEYYRYTQDTIWLKEVSPKLVKACQFLIDWRNRNKIDSLKGKGYGMIDGKVADPNDHYRQYMLNGYGYLGLARMSEVFNGLGLPEKETIQQEADHWKEDIRAAFIYSMGNSPLIPIGDGAWTPTAPPWVESIGPRVLYFNREKFFSHGTFTLSDDLLGSLYLVFCEVFDPNDWYAKKILDFHSELLLEDNSSFSQPYYSRYNWLQLARGMVKPFLKTYYQTFAAMADRNIYTFTEHTYPNSTHKVHEEAWFLMETRWMLYREEGSTLNLFKTIPRKWLKNGNKIELEKVRSYFGEITVRLNSTINNGQISVDISCPNLYKNLREVNVRVPHPDRKMPIKVTGGVFDKETESVKIISFRGEHKIVLYYE